jgi:hypothetical protein
MFINFIHLRRFVPPPRAEDNQRCVLRILYSCSYVVFCPGCVRIVKSCHSREDGNLELFNIPGFRVALRLRGMTKKVIEPPPSNLIMRALYNSHRVITFQVTRFEEQSDEKSFFNIVVLKDFSLRSK